MDQLLKEKFEEFLKLYGIDKGTEVKIEITDGKDSNWHHMRINLIHKDVVYDYMIYEFDRKILYGSGCFKIEEEVQEFKAQLEKEALKIYLEN